MIPLRDDNPTRSFAFVTVVLIAANLLVFVHQLSLPTEEALQAFVAEFGLTPGAVTTSRSWPDVQTAFTSMFLHGGWLHLLGNMLYLWIFGNNIEDSIGHVGFLFFYGLAGVGAAATQVATNPGSMIPMIGASGAVSGVLGAYLLLFPRARVFVLFPIWIFLRFFYVPAWLMLVIWFGLQLLSGMLALRDPSPTGGVAFWAHIGGFAAGMLLIPLFKKPHVRWFRG